MAVSLVLCSFYSRNIGKHSVENRAVILIITLNSGIEFTPNIRVLVGDNSKFHIYRLLRCHSHSDSLKCGTAVIGINKVIYAIRSLVKTFFGSAEIFAARLVCVKCLKVHIPINLKQAYSARYHIDKVIHRPRLISDFFALSLALSHIGKGNLAKRIFAVIACGAVNIIILRGIIHYV